MRNRYLEKIAAFGNPVPGMSNTFEGSATRMDMTPYKPPVTTPHIPNANPISKPMGIFSRVKRFAIKNPLVAGAGLIGAGIMAGRSSNTQR
jgi:hypothetical protein